MAEMTARQREILEQTLAIVRESGLAGVTIRAIAERVGFSEPALYRHFANKQAVILGLMSLLEQRLIEPIEHIAADLRRTVPERLVAILAHHANLVRRENSLPVLLLAEASVGNDAALSARLGELFQRYQRAVEGLAREGQHSGVITTAVQSDSLALLVLAMPAALAIRRRLRPDAEADERFQQTLMPFIVDRIGNDSAAMAPPMVPPTTTRGASGRVS